MRCEEVNELIQRSLDEDLNETDTQMVQTHLKECEACSGFYHRLQFLQTSLESIPKVNPPISIVDSILPELARIDQELGSFTKANPIKRNLFRKKWIASFGATAAGIILILSYIGYQNAGLRESADFAENAAVYSLSANEEKVMDSATTSDSRSLQKSAEPVPKVESNPNEGAMFGITSVSPSQNPKEMMSVASADGEYTVVYNKMQIEIYTKDGNLVVSITAHTGQQFSDIFWKDYKHVQYSSNVEGKLEKWTIDVTTGEQTPTTIE